MPWCLYKQFTQPLPRLRWMLIDFRLGNGPEWPWTTKDLTDFNIVPEEAGTDQVNRTRIPIGGWSNVGQVLLGCRPLKFIATCGRSKFRSCIWNLAESWRLYAYNCRVQRGLLTLELGIIEKPSYVWNVGQSTSTAHNRITLKAVNQSVSKHHVSHFKEDHLSSLPGSARRIEC